MEFVSPGLAIMLAATCRRLRTFALATAFSVRQSRAWLSMMYVLTHRSPVALE